MLHPRILAVATCLTFLTPAYSQRLLTTQLFGGSGNDVPVAIAGDRQGNIYVAGTTTSPDLPAAHGYQSRPAVTPLSISVDGGGTFRGVAIPGVSQAVALAATPDGAIVYIASANGVMRSADGGNTWTATTPGIPDLPEVMALNPVDPNTVYAGAATGFYRSTDGGNHWSLIPGLMNQYETAIYFQILIDPLNPSTIWVCAGNTPNPSGIFTSNDGGNTFTEITLPPVGFSPYTIAQSIALDPLHSGTVFAAGDGMPLMKSTDAGQTWSTLASVYGFVTVDPGNPSTIYCLTGLGVEKSTDGGNTFVNTGFTASGSNLVAVDPANSSRLYAVLQSTLYTSADAGATWSPTSVHAVTQFLALPGRVLAGAQIPPQAYIAKFSPDLSQLLWSTYLGGSGYQTVTALTVDSSSNAYVSGTTTSPDFPITSGAAPAAGSAFLSKISADGTQLLASVYFGASFPRIAAIAVDPSGAVYVAGTQAGSALATTPQAFQPSLPGPCGRPQDPGGFQPSSNGFAFVTKLTSDLSNVTYSTYLTGTCGSAIFGMQVDQSGVATVVGGTYSLDFPTTKGAMMTTAPGTDESGFLAQFSADGGSLLYSTYLGGGQTTEAHALLTDSAGNWYVTGGGSPPVTPGATHVKAAGSCPFILGFGPPIPQPPTGAEDAFVMVFNAHSTSPALTATVGGGCLDEGDSIALDGGGNIWISGYTTSTDFPSQSLVGGIGGASGAFLAAFSPTGDALLSSQYTGQSPRLVAAGGKVTAAAWAPAKPTLPRQDTNHTALAQFDAISAPPVELDALNAYSGTGALTAVAPGQVMLLAGRHFGPSQTIAGSVVNGAVARSIGGLQVTFDGVPAPLLSLQDQTIALVVPFEVRPNGSVMQVVENGAPVSNPITVPVAAQKVDVLLVMNADGTVNSQQHPAPPGSTVSVFVTGLGTETPTPPDGQVATAPSPTPPVFVGPNVNVQTVLVQPSYVGAAVGLVAGIVQVNIPIPQGVSSGFPAYLNATQFPVPVYISQ